MKDVHRSRTCPQRNLHLLFSFGIARFHHRAQGSRIVVAISPWLDQRQDADLAHPSFTLFHGSAVPASSTGFSFPSNTVLVDTLPTARHGVCVCCDSERKQLIITLFNLISIHLEGAITGDMPPFFPTPRKYRGIDSATQVLVRLGREAIVGSWQCPLLECHQHAPPMPAPIRLQLPLRSARSGMVSHMLKIPATLFLMVVAMTQTSQQRPASRCKCTWHFDHPNCPTTYNRPYPVNICSLQFAHFILLPQRTTLYTSYLIGFID